MIRPQETPIFTVTVPWEPAWSKNRQWRSTRGGRVYLSAEARAARDALAWHLRRVIRSHAFVPRTKVWLDITVRRRSLHNDPINIIDVVADVVKTVIGVDDNLFAIARLDWVWDPTRDPELTLALWQDPVPLPSAAVQRRRLRDDAPPLA